LRYIAKTLAKAGVVPKAVEIAGGITSAKERVIALQEVGEAQADAGDRIGALATIRLAAKIEGAPERESLRTMARSPSQLGDILGELGQPPAGVGPVGVVVGTDALGSVIASGQVDQLPANLGRRQIVEGGLVLGPDDGQAPVQPDQGGLEEVVGLLPAPHVRIATEHRTGQGHEPPLGQGDQPIAGRVVARPQPVQQVARLGRLAQSLAPPSLGRPRPINDAILPPGHPFPRIVLFDRSPGDELLRPSSE
jgi:hypothetical protein